MFDPFTNVHSLAMGSLFCSLSLADHGGLVHRQCLAERRSEDPSNTAITGGGKFTTISL